MQPKPVQGSVRTPPRSIFDARSQLTRGAPSGSLAFAGDGALGGILWEAPKVAKELDQPRLAFGKRVPAPLRDHEGEGAHVPCAPLEFDESCIREVFCNHMTRHVPPAQVSSEQIVLRTEVIHPPLAFAGDPLLWF